jgi:histidine triad (HIT) family protein
MWPMASIFSRIVAGEIPCHRVFEDERTLAFLDIRPSTSGHTLVIPKVEVDHLFDLDDADYAAVWATTREVAHAIEVVTGAERVAVIVAGFEVPHAHVHLIPAQSMSDVHLGSAAADEAQLVDMAARLRAALG